LIALTIFCEACRLWSSSLCSLHQLPATSFLRHIYTFIFFVRFSILDDSIMWKLPMSSCTRLLCIVDVDVKLNYF
jgi:hypothetical protein